MAKLPSNWKSNPLKTTPVVLYDDASITYDSPVTLFDAIDTALDNLGKLAQAWVSSTKPRTLWGSNPAFPSGSIFDPVGVTFDTIFPVYDGISGESPISTKAATAWSPA